MFSCIFFKISIFSIVDCVDLFDNSSSNKFGFFSKFAKNDDTFVVFNNLALSANCVIDKSDI